MATNRSQRAQITDTTDLGLAMLIVESEDGHYEPVAVVATINEAREIAQGDFASRRQDLERGREALCPYVYKIWSPNSEGEYEVVYEIKDRL